MGGKKQYIGKRSKESRQNKRATFAKDPSPQRQPLTEDDLAKAVEPLESLLVEASTFKDTITKIKALRRAEDKQTDLQGKQLVARQRQRCKDAGFVIFGLLCKKLRLMPYAQFFTSKRISFFSQDRLCEKLDFSADFIHA